MPPFPFSYKKDVIFSFIILEVKFCQTIFPTSKINTWTCIIYLVYKWFVLYLILIYITFWFNRSFAPSELNSKSRLFEIRRTIGPSGQKITSTANTAKHAGPGVQKKFGLCILICTGNRKCNWYTGTITVNSELDSPSNDIYFLNMQLFPW